MVLTRWAEYLQNLPNKVHSTDPGILDDLPTLPIMMTKLFFYKVEKSILSLKVNKAAGPDNIPAVVITYGGCALSLNAGPPSVSHSNGKMQTLFLYTNRRVTDQNVATAVASPFSL